MQTGLPPHQRPRALTNAFTLVELLAVIGVMVLLLSFTLPALRSGGNLNKTAWDVAGAIEQAQTYALSQNTYVWVGFNEENVSNTTDRVAVFIAASKDGTSSLAQANIAMLDKLRTFENVALASSGSGFTTTTDGYNARPTTNLRILAGSGNSVAIPSTGKPRTVTLADANNLVLQIAPDGSITYPGSSTTDHWFELRLQGKRGSTDIEGDTAVVQISSLTGRARVFRPMTIASVTP